MSPRNDAAPRFPLPYFVSLESTKDKAELGVRVLAVALEVLAHGNRLLDEAVEVLGDLRGEAVLLQQAQDFATCEDDGALSLDKCTASFLTDPTFS